MFGDDVLKWVLPLIGTDLLAIYPQYKYLLLDITMQNTRITKVISCKRIKSVICVLFKSMHYFSMLCI